MIVLGLTGSIAMGKSETAGMFRRLGIPVFDADAVVHQLYAPSGKAVGPVSRAFPGVLGIDRIDRQLLSQAVANDQEGFARLEAIVHPLVQAEQQNFLAEAKAQGHALVVLDIPLLYETGRDKDVDKVVVVTAPSDIQRQRALARPGMTEEKLAVILARQVPDSEKRRRADFLVDTGTGKDAAFAQISEIVDALVGGKGKTKNA